VAVNPQVDEGDDDDDDRPGGDSDRRGNDEEDGSVLSSEGLGPDDDSDDNDDDENDDNGNHVAEAMFQQVEGQIANEAVDPGSNDNNPPPYDGTESNDESAPDVDSVSREPLHKRRREGL
jgi:hypothetical protein